MTDTNKTANARFPRNSPEGSPAIEKLTNIPTTMNIVIAEKFLVIKAFNDRRFCIRNTG
ncbi:MAG: hypothetical protein HY752_02510 [Nitrospirae bacterium]|nr:hypothetical protein [Nitrospirota bacterium]